MKIAFDAKRAFNNVTGLGNYSRYIINALLEFYPQKEYLFFTPSQGISKESVIRHQGNYKVCGPESFLHKQVPGLWRASFVVEDLKECEPDIFHGLSNELPIGINKVKLGKVVTVHDLIFLRFPSLYNSIDRYIYRKKFFSACKVSDKIIAISQQTKEDLVDFFRIGEEKIEINYQDCLAVFHETVAPEQIAEVKKKFNLPENYVLSVGTLEPRKNHLNILKALSILKEADRPYVVIAGKATDYKKELESYIAAHNLGDYVNIVEYVSFRFLPALYQGASLFIYPSIFEGFGIPLLEALNSRVPVISSKGSCFSEAGGPDSVYTDPQSPEELAVAIQNILTDEGKQQKMKENGYAHALKFRKENTIPQLVKIYQNLL
ncbi:glycosyltransferase family 1 protein [Cytophagaceae bacterium ABcell3]|nr:glycosyltransferase family 1 protein [Cytophagaceae bacterium ABcell3]